MSRKCLSEHQISEILKYLDDMEVDSEEELIDNEDSEIVLYLKSRCFY